MPFRSVLYVPAANQRAMDKIATLDADAIIIDLEDSALPDQKEAARARAKQAFEQRPSSRPMGLRINAVDSSWIDQDLALLTSFTPDFLVLPKVEAPSDVEQVAGRFKGSIWAMIETPKGVLNASAIASANDQMQALLLGLEDLAKELAIDALQDRANLSYAMQAVVMAAKAHGLYAIDGVYKNLKDDQGFEQQCQQSRQLGYDGKSLIHPKTIEACNRCFSPSEDQIAHAKAIIEAFEHATSEGLSIATLDEQMIEALHVEQAKAALVKAGL